MSDEGTVEGDWLIALEQHAGRGRQGRQWVSSAGNFYGSTLVRLKRDDPPAPTLSLAAGLALIEALDVATKGHAPLMLKWPNDVILRGRKLAGILLERSGDRIAVGFGVNLASAPDLADRVAASLGGEMQPQAFAPLLAARFARRLSLWRADDRREVADAWQKRAHPVGAELNVHLSREESIAGCFAGLEDDGALRLRMSDGSIQLVRAGDVALD